MAVLIPDETCEHIELFSSVLGIGDGPFPVVGPYVSCLLAGKFVCEFLRLLEVVEPFDRSELFTAIGSYSESAVSVQLIHFCKFSAKGYRGAYVKLEIFKVVETEFRRQDIISHIQSEIVLDDPLSVIAGIILYAVLAEGTPGGAVIGHKVAAASEECSYFSEPSGRYQGVSLLDL